MKIMMISINYWPEVTGIGAFTTYRAEYLAASGHEVEVCTTFPYYPEWKVKGKYKYKLWQNENKNDVKISRTWAYVPAKVRSFKRILHEASFSLSVLLRALLCRKPDVMLVVSPPLGLAMVAITLSKLWGIPYVFDVEDLQPDSAADMGMLPLWTVKVLYFIERAAYRHAGLISTITRGMKDKIASKGDWEKKIVLFEPRMNASLLNTTNSEADAFCRKYDLENKFFVTHSGNMGVKQALGTVVEAAKIMAMEEEYCFLLVGDGSAREEIYQKVLNEGLRNITFLPLLEDEDYRGVLAASGVCLVTQQKTVSEIAFPSKIVSYFSAGCPVIVSANESCEVARTVNESGAGFVVPAEDAEALVEAIREVKEQDKAEMERNARNYAIQRWSDRRVLGYLEKCLVRAAGKERLYQPQEEVNQ
ncbi:glycosyltransferase family 4 protein [Telmatobacter bradus]|uniref:glycosyltransferase family 4 protein n=1 Tax=Telmatobacter bradus TaxID=474953 RepID=UPI003B4378A5